MCNEDLPLTLCSISHCSHRPMLHKKGHKVAHCEKLLHSWQTPYHMDVRMHICHTVTHVYTQHATRMQVLCEWMDPEQSLHDRAIKWKQKQVALAVIECTQEQMPPAVLDETKFYHTNSILKMSARQTLCACTFLVLYSKVCTSVKIISALSRCVFQCSMQFIYICSNYSPSSR